MRLSWNGANYWYEIHGDGEAIVILHGFTGSTQTWSRFKESFQSKFKIIVIDLPGHGKTVTPESVTMEQCCQAINTILQGNCIESFHLIGYSMGGRTALTYAMLYQEQLKTLVLESASPGLESEEERRKRISNDEKLAARIEEEGLEAFVDYWENIPLFKSQKLLPNSIQESIRQERLYQSPQGLALSLRSMGTGSQPSWWTTLSTLNKPVLLMVGELDHKFIRINRRMNEIIPDSTLHIVKNTGHAIHVEEPEIFGKIVEEFILSSR